jgi:hypothetical protein
MPASSTNAHITAGFSLASLEELVDENQRLQQQADKARQQPKAELAMVRRLEAEVARLRCEKDALQQRVERSEALRRKGARALTELQQVHNVQECACAALPPELRVVHLLMCWNVARC